MSAPDTDLKKQKKDHRPAIWGMRSVVIFAAVLLLLLVGWVVLRGNEPVTPDQRIDASTGQVIEENGSGAQDAAGTPPASPAPEAETAPQGGTGQ